MMVKESTHYDNYLDKNARKDDPYSHSLDKFFDEPIDVPIVDNTKKKSGASSDFKWIYLHFRNIDDYVDFCYKINQVLSLNVKEIYFPIQSKLFDDDSSVATIDKNLLLRESGKKIGEKKISSEEKEWRKHWRNMPEYVQEKNFPFHTIKVRFEAENDMKSFSSLLDQDLTEKTKSIWHPELLVEQNYKLRWMQKPEEHNNLKYPMYIVSKGRYGYMHTSRSLARMQIPHYIVIEPQEADLYEKALDDFNIRPWVTLLIAPFSNHGDGPGRARNWAWDHSMSIGATSHWVLDDNISDFYRLNRNKRIRFESGVGFRVMEDFVDRYENVPISGPQYRFFVAPDAYKPPYAINTRIYSTLLIRNDCKHRWRGRYNEDTDICLRVLKDGDCTIQFNAFLQGKSATQTVKGGNTAEFYHKENGDNKDKWRDSYLNPDGTINKSKMLVDMHPDVTTMVWRYGRWHHHVNYDGFKRNRLIPKVNINEIPDDVNNYGMYLINNYGDE
jgi:hypothetical protein